MAKSLYRYYHSFVRSEASHEAHRPCYLSHPQHTTYIQVHSTGGFPSNNSSDRSYTGINILSHLLFATSHLNYLAPLVFFLLKTKKEKVISLITSWDR